LANLAVLTELIVAFSHASISDERQAVATERLPRPNPLAARPDSYIAIAARTLGRCGIGALILPDTLGEPGLVIM